MPDRPMTNRLNGTALARFLSYFHIGDQDACWLWLGATSDHGYAQFWDGERRPVVHRVSYELFVGAIPDGMTLDHVCHTRDVNCPGGDCLHRRCVNPAHLEPVSQRENVLRGKGFVGVNLRKTRCINGHEFTPDNTKYVFSKGHHPERQCLACRRSRDLASYHAGRKKRYRRLADGSIKVTVKT